MTPSLRGRLPLLVIIGIAVLLRVTVVLWSPPTADAVLTPLNDSTDYDHLARSLLAGDGFVGPGGEPTAFRPPLYPLWLALVYTLFGVQNLLAVALLQCVMAGAACAIVHVLATCAGLPRTAGLMAAAAYALYPAFILQAGQILTEELGRLLLLAAVWCFLRGWASSEGLWLGAAAGLLFGVAVLNKSVMAAALPFVGLLPLLRGSESWGQRLRRAAAFGLPVAFVIGGWTLRNARVSDGEFIPVSTNFPITFSQGVTQWSFYTAHWYGDELELLEAPADFLQLTQLRSYGGIKEELAVGRKWSAAAREWIGQHPLLYAKLTTRKFLHYWGPSVRNSPPVRLAALASMGPVLLLGWLGILGALCGHAGPQRRAALVALAIAIPTTLPYAISQCDVRYRLGIADPLWMVAAAGFVTLPVMARLRRVARPAGT